MKEINNLKKELNIVSTKREDIIDIIKAIGIILMVAGHAYFPGTSFIYLFYMAIFFIASGYCYKESNSNNIKNVIDFMYFI